jgi:DNA-binding GntR family transcriptional regulator
MQKNRPRSLPPENGSVQDNSVYFTGKFRQVDSGSLDTGPFLMRFLALVANSRKLSGKQVWNRLGVHHSLLNPFRTRPHFFRDLSQGVSSRKTKLVTICLRTGMRPAQLAASADEKWVETLNEIIAPFTPWSAPGVSLEQELGDAWKPLRQQAADVCSMSPALLPTEPHYDRRDDTANRIRRLIFSGKLGPNDVIDVVYLTSQLDERPSVIVAALKSLIEQGIVVTAINGDQISNCRVAAISQKQAAEIMHLRYLVEGSLYKLCIAKRGRLKAVLQVMQNMNAQMELAAREGDTNAFIDADLRFHLSATDETYITRQLLNDLLCIIRTVQPHGDQEARARSETLRAHKRIVGHLAKPVPDADKAAAALKSHLAASMRFLFPR